MFCMYSLPLLSCSSDNNVFLKSDNKADPQPEFLFIEFNNNRNPPISRSEELTVSPFAVAADNFLTISGNSSDDTIGDCIGLIIVITSARSKSFNNSEG
ncbi:unnamed protein product [Ambrosiozyma monospora]|uniref:Unnamed protein product n=1 Tax=Ambrosiozyma monospora TaxID=43982 RepID=A0ACB5UAE6_AMBMO|nr:unnamed protein product [Ambrosiozyma monospora]